MKMTILLMAVLVACTNVEVICMQSQNKSPRRHVRSVSENSPLRRMPLDRNRSVVTNPIKRSPTIERVIAQNEKLRRTATMMPKSPVK